MKKRTNKRSFWAFSVYLSVLAVFITGCLFHIDDSQPSRTEVNISNFSPTSPTTGLFFTEVQNLTSKMDSLRTIGNTMAVDSVSRIRDLVYDTIRNTAKRDIQATIDTIPGLNYVLTGATGMYLGNREPSVVVTLLGQNSALHARAVRALSIYAVNEKQMSIIESQPLDLNKSWYGKVEGDYNYEPSVSFTLNDGVSLDAISDRLLMNGFAGFTIRHNTTTDVLDIYYVPAFEIDENGLGRSRNVFLTDIDRFEQMVSVRGWLSGKAEIVRKLRVHWF